MPCLSHHWRKRRSGAGGEDAFDVEEGVGEEQEVAGVLVPAEGLSEVSL